MLFVLEFRSIFPDFSLFHRWLNFGQKSKREYRGKWLCPLHQVCQRFHDWLFVSVNDKFVLYISQILTLLLVASHNSQIMLKYIAIIVLKNRYNSQININTRTRSSDNLKELLMRFGFSSSPNCRVLNHSRCNNSIRVWCWHLAWAFTIPCDVAMQWTFIHSFIHIEKKNK